MGKKDTSKEDLKASFKQTQEYIDNHLAICKRLNKPLVLEEFGYPRDGFSFSLKSTTKARDAYYKYVMEVVAENAANGGFLLVVTSGVGVVMENLVMSVGRLETTLPAIQHMSHKDSTVCCIRQINNKR